MSSKGAGVYGTIYGTNPFSEEDFGLLKPFPNTKTAHTATESLLWRLRAGGWASLRGPDNGTYYPLATAMAAWLFRQLPPERCAIRFSEILDVSVKSLSWRAARRNIGDELVFASHFIGWLAYSSNSHEVNAATHFTASLGLLLDCLENVPQSGYPKNFSDTDLS